MSKSLNEKYAVEIPNSKNLVCDYQACALNSIIIIIEKYGYIDSINIEHIKELFDYNKDGISDHKYKFRKLNNYLNKNRIPLKFNVRRYTSLQDLYKYLHNQGMVPVFFYMNILKFTKNSYNELDYQIEFGDIYQSDNKHCLLFVGYDKKGEIIKFIDPSYQLPWINKNEENLSKYFISLSIKAFYECTKQLKTLLEVKFSKKDAEKFKKKEYLNKNQTKLK